MVAVAWQLGRLSNGLQIACMTWAKQLSSQT